MKKLFTILVAVLLTATVWAQAPQKMSYQAVIRNSSDVLVTNTQVGMEINIRQGSQTGTIVYTETQTPTSNANGLVSIEIGGGAGFNTIDWANDTYYIETKTDPTGGTTYTITGTSQLLSVPYALHAKSAESVSGTITETDPIYVSSQAANITENDIFNLSNLSGENTGDQNLNFLVTKLALADSIAQLRSEIQIVATYSVGDYAQGGVVFFVDETGQHGLVCSKENQNGGSGIRWYAGTNGVTQALGDGLYAGEANTAIIIAAQIAIGDDYATYAARICNELLVTEGDITYGDWYLPSKYELNLIYENKSIIEATSLANGGQSFIEGYYWSSTEFEYDLSKVQKFDSTGNQVSGFKNSLCYVRSIRSF
ncbi:MAG: hypothetical protein JXR36_13265 [Bacteroidales bacterium]|nr:hypothetical protein [Bacteroidales bacterium]